MSTGATSTPAAVRPAPGVRRRSRIRPLDVVLVVGAVVLATVVARVIVEKSPSLVVFATVMGSLYLGTIGLVFVRPGHGLVVYALLLPVWEWLRLNLVYRHIISYGWATLGTRWEELFFVVLLISRRRSDWSAAIGQARVLTALLVAYGALQAAYFAASGFGMQALWGFKVDFAYLVPLLLLRFAHLEREDLRRIFVASVAAATAVAAFGIYQVHFLGEEQLTALGFGRQTPFGSFIPWNFKRASIGYFRAISIVGDPLSLSAYMLVMLLWTIPVAIYAPDRRLAHGTKVAIVIMAAALYFTFTRSAWVGAVAGVLVILIAMRRRRETPIFALLGLIGAVGLLVVTGGLDFILVTVNLAEPSSRNHFRELYDGFKFMLAHPFGIGIGTVGRAFLRFLGIGKGFGVESWFLQIGIELGVAGLLLYVGMSLEAARQGWISFRRSADPFLELFALGATSAFVGLTVYGITLPVWGFVAGPYLATLVIALAVFHVRRADGMLAPAGPPGPAGAGARAGDP